MGMPCLEVEDFCNAHKWCPNLDTCYPVEGAPGQPGLIFYYAASTQAPSDDHSTDHEKTTRWAKKKLLMIDPIQRCYSYELVDNNIGFKKWVHGENGCTIEWSFVADPIEGWKPEDLASFIDHRLQLMAN
ncbi:hypothetical protein ACOSQ2_008661 [Xanthoceras sorbifolium]